MQPSPQSENAGQGAYGCSLTRILNSLGKPGELASGRCPNQQAGSLRYLVAQPSWLMVNGSSPSPGSNNKGVKMPPPQLAIFDAAPTALLGRAAFMTGQQPV